MKTIKIKDYYGKYQIVPVSDELYEEWKKLQNETQRIYRAEVRHRSAVSLEDIDIYVIHTQESPVEEKLIHDETDRELFRAIEQLTPTQKKRVKMLLEDKTLWDLSKESSCSYNALKFSLRYALKKIRNIMGE